MQRSDAERDGLDDERLPFDFTRPHCALFDQRLWDDWPPDRKERYPGQFEEYKRNFPKEENERMLGQYRLNCITYKEFLPALLGPHAPSLFDYEGFDPSVDPSVANEFSTALFRVGHTMLSPNLALANDWRIVGLLPLREAFFNVDFIADGPRNVSEHGLPLEPPQQPHPNEKLRLRSAPRSFEVGPQ